MRRSIVAAAFALLVAGCGDDSGGTTSSAPPGSTTVPVSTTLGSGTVATTAATIPSGGDGSCAVTVTGGEERYWEGADDAYAFTTDYWYSDDELRTQYGFMADEDDPSFDEALASGEPIVGLFIFNCVGADGDSVSLFPSISTKRSDLPFGPGTYEISGGFFDPSEKPAGSFSVLYGPGSDDIWGLDGIGTLVITRWDNARIQGTFSFMASERLVGEPREVLVEGSFDLTCQFSDTCR